MFKNFSFVLYLLSLKKVSSMASKMLNSTQMISGVKVLQKYFSVGIDGFKKYEKLLYYLIQNSTNVKIIH